MRKALSLFMAIVMILLCAPIYASAQSFNDVKPSDWYSSAVEYVSKEEFFTGTGNGKFSPKGKMTRGMFVTVLGRMAEVFEEDYPGCSFKDVEIRSYYAPYVQWAYKHNLVSGVKAKQFAPNSNISRQDMVKILYSYAEKTDNDTSFTDEKYNVFLDTADVSSYAIESMKWATSKGIVKGEKGKLFPKRSISRAEVAQIIFNSKDILKERGNIADYPDVEIEMPDEYMSITYTTDVEIDGEYSVNSLAYIYDIENDEVLDLVAMFPFGTSMPNGVFHKDNGKFYCVATGMDEQYSEIFEWDFENDEITQLTTHLVDVNHILPYKDRIYYVAKPKRQYNLEFGYVDLNTGEIEIWKDDGDTCVWSLMLDRDKEKFYMSTYSSEELYYQGSIQGNNDFQNPDHHIYEVDINFENERKLYTAKNGRIHNVMEQGNEVLCRVEDGIGDRRNIRYVAIDIDKAAEVPAQRYPKNVMSLRTAFISKDGTKIHSIFYKDGKEFVGYFDRQNGELMPAFTPVKGVGMINKVEYVY